MRFKQWRYTIPLRLRSLFGRTRVEEELDEELRFHLECRTAQEIAAGRSPAEARRMALASMDGLEQRKEECREARRLNLLEHLARDFRLGARSLRKSPAFTLTALLALTLGIGVNTAVFSVVHAVLLRPLAYADPDRLVRLYETNTSISADHDSVSVPNFLDWKDQARAFSAIGAIRWEAVTLSGGANPEAMYAQRVSPGLLEMLRVRPAKGRGLTEDDAAPGGAAVALITHELWIRRFAGARDVLGQQIQLNFQPYTIVGVLPPRFRTPSQFGVADPVDVLVPMKFSSAELKNRGEHNLQVFGRMRPGVSTAQAQSEMTAIAEGLARTYPNNQGRGVRVLSLMDEVVGGYRTSLLLIFGASALILLISCANLASALLARGLGQQHEIAVRFALGAGRVSIVRQILVQNLILALAGCLCGAGGAFWAVKVLHVLAPARLPRVDEVAVDGATLAFALGASLLTGVAFGLLPAFQLSRSRPYEALKGRGTAGARSIVMRWRNGVMVGQVALSVVLLVGAGLLLKSFARLRGIDLGFSTNHALAMRIMLPRSRYPEQARRLQFFTDVADRVRNLPGVEAVGYTNQLPMRGGWGGSFRVEQPEVPMGANDDSDFQLASPGYFEALRIRLLRGRLFGPSDGPGALLVVIVNHAFAHRYWPNTDPVGHHVFKSGPQPYTIVGVVDDVHLAGPEKPANIEIYFAAAQAQGLPSPPMDLAVRTANDPEASLKAIQQVVWSLDKDQPVTGVRTLDEVLSQFTSSARFQTVLIATFAGLALLLAGVGIYGVVSYSIAQRAPEIGIRIAVGASSTDILGLVVRQVSLLVAAGAALGIALSLVLSRYAASMLFGVKPRDPASFAAAAGVLALAGLIAAIVPARRALAIDPIGVLRVE